MRRLTTPGLNFHILRSKVNGISHTAREMLSHARAVVIKLQPIFELGRLFIPEKKSLMKVPSGRVEQTFALQIKKIIRLRRRVVESRKNSSSCEYISSIFLNCTFSFFSLISFAQSMDEKENVRKSVCLARLRVCFCNSRLRCLRL